MLLSLKFTPRHACSRWQSAETPDCPSLSLSHTLSHTHTHTHTHKATCTHSEFTAPQISLIRWQQNKHATHTKSKACVSWHTALQNTMYTKVYHSITREVGYMLSVHSSMQIWPQPLRASYYKNIEIRFHNRIKPNKSNFNFYLKMLRLYLIILTFSPQNCKTCTKNWEKTNFLAIFSPNNFDFSELSLFHSSEFVFHNSFFLSELWETKSDFWDKVTITLLSFISFF